MTKADPVIVLNINESWTLTREELWPDGNGPEVITREAVEQMIKDCGGPRSILRSWDLDVDIDIEVSVVPALSHRHSK